MAPTHGRCALLSVTDHHHRQLLSADHFHHGLLIGKILPFLKGCDAEKQKVVVHCSGGSGRTGHVLAAWLVFGRGWAYADAIAAVKKSGRNPFEAIQSGNARPEDLEKLLS
jgi:protein-tyrosine phosphatase